VPASWPSWAANTGAGYRADPTPSGRLSEVRGTIDRWRALARVRAPRPAGGARGECHTVL